ncbi:MAG: hypothetical protein M3176_01255 [Chloroflexota bacterium]|nr:hypothetical protein [Chloroflexota bacterium]
MRDLPRIYEICRGQHLDLAEDDDALALNLTEPERRFLLRKRVICLYIGSAGSMCQW